MSLQCQSLGDGTVRVSGPCFRCKRSHSIMVNELGLHMWAAEGELIQNALPLTAKQDREFLISQMCPKCFDEVTKEE